MFDEEIYVSCMKRFLYVRCYDSLELLSSLKVVFVLKYHIVGFVLDFFTLLIKFVSLCHYVADIALSDPTTGIVWKSSRSAYD